MRLNFACAETGSQTSIEVDDDKKLYPFFEKALGSEVSGDTLGDEFKGYVFRITGGNDKQGFPMLQGVLTNRRVRLLFKEGMKCYRARRDGQHRRKSVRGCIVSPDLSALNLVISKKGEQHIPGLTDVHRPRRVGPKRASKIRKMFGLSKDENVRPFVPRRKIEGKKRTKAPRVQRLITANRLQRKRHYKAVLKERREHAVTAREEYKVLMEEHTRAKRAAEVAKKVKKTTPPPVTTSA